MTTSFDRHRAAARWLRTSGVFARYIKEGPTLSERRTSSLTTDLEAGDEVTVTDGQQSSIFSTGDSATVEYFYGGHGGSVFHEEYAAVTTDDRKLPVGVKVAAIDSVTDDENDGDDQLAEVLQVALVQTVIMEELVQVDSSDPSDFLRAVKSASERIVKEVA